VAITVERHVIDIAHGDAGFAVTSPTFGATPADDDIVLFWVASDPVFTEFRATVNGANPGSANCTILASWNSPGSVSFNLEHLYLVAHQCVPDSISSDALVIVGGEIGIGLQRLRGTGGFPTLVSSDDAWSSLNPDTSPTTLQVAALAGAYQFRTYFAFSDSGFSSAPHDWSTADGTLTTVEDAESNAGNGVAGGAMVGYEIDTVAPGAVDFTVTFTGSNALDAGAGGALLDFAVGPAAISPDMSFPYERRRVSAQSLPFSLDTGLLREL